MCRLISRNEWQRGMIRMAVPLQCVCRVHMALGLAWEFLELAVGKRAVRQLNISERVFLRRFQQ